MNLSRLKAFFHDPPDKALDITQHEKRAGEYFSILGISEDLKSDIIKEADHLSSASDRMRFPNDKQGNKIIINFDKDAELTHPLGSGRIKLSDFGYLSADMGEVEKVIQAAITKLHSEANGDYKRLMLEMWRNIPDQFSEFELEKFKLGNLWSLLPADTRIPDHSILDHNWLSAAIAASLPEPAFLKFSIAPVQSFIATAKRTEDHWMGSFLLSYLISQVISAMIDEEGPEHIIFPYVKGQPLVDYHLKKQYSVESFQESRYAARDIAIPTLSNIIFAVVPHNRARAIAESMKKRILESWGEIGHHIRKSVPQFQDISIEKVWNSQIDGLLEVYYVIYKWPAPTEASGSIAALESAYKEIFGEILPKPEGKIHNVGSYWQSLYKITDSAFNSRKSLRSFNQLKTSDELTKCSMCGEREALHPSTIGKTSELTKFWREIAKDCNFKIDAAGRDKLCAVCFVKRMASERYFKENVFNSKEDIINYPSTSTIAALPYKLNIIKQSEKNQELFPTIKAYNQIISELGIQGNFNWNLIHYIPSKILYIHTKEKSFEFNEFANFLSFDGQWIFEESFSKKALVDGGYLTTDGFEEKKPLITAVKDIIKKLSELTSDRPSKYYAVLAMDGDNMGKWISGTHGEWPILEKTVHSKIESAMDEAMKKKKRPLSPSIHSFISKALNQFSLKLVKRIVESEYPGKLIYAGGDDVLAFIPLEYALQVAEKIRFTFSGNLDENNVIDLKKTKGYIVLKESGKRILYPTLGNGATMSAGIVIAHKGHDLQDVLYQSRNAEKEAKDRFDRNSLVIRIVRGSGGISSTGLKWMAEDTRSVNLIRNILARIAKDDKEEGLSMSFFGAIVNDILRLSTKDPELIQALIRRQVTRNLLVKRNEGEHKEEFQERKNGQLKETVDELTRLLNNAAHMLSQPYENMADTLLLIRFMATGGKR